MFTFARVSSPYGKRHPVLSAKIRKLCDNRQVPDDYPARRESWYIVELSNDPLKADIRKYLIAACLFVSMGHMVFGAGLLHPSTQGLKNAVSDTATVNTADTVSTTQEDSTILPNPNLILTDSVPNLTNSSDTTAKGFLDDILSGKNKDSVVFAVKKNMVYIYNQGDVLYQGNNLKADYMEVDMDTRQIYAHGLPDTSGTMSRAQFLEGSNAYEMDTLTYNLKTGKAKIKGATTQQGENYVTGRVIKKMPDNTINIAKGRLTTCDDTEHPHFYLYLTKGKVIPGKKTIFGPSYLVMEDVPIPFLGLPFGFFPIMGEKHSGFIIPTYGEELSKGFFLRDGGYYFSFGDYADVTVTGGIYTLGSWEAAVTSRYVKRYKFSGNFGVRYSKDIFGEKGMPDYINTSSYRINWTHMQDPKFKPNSTFSASVNFSSSSFSKYGSTNMNDYLNTQTNSSISYSKSWAGKPFSFSTNIQHSQNSSDSTVSLSFPNVVFNVSRIYPFQRKNAVGKKRWYEKIALSYTGTLTNNVTVKERDLFTKSMFSEMKNGVNHTIPISTSLNLFKYVNISPSANYNERWYFRKIDKEWDPVLKQVVNADTTYGFYRVYNYSFSASASTKLYGTFQFKGEKFPIKAIRHVLTPNIGLTYTPDFSKSKYGFYKPVQSDSTGTISYYSPFEGSTYGIPSRGESASITFGLQNTLEMKVRSDQDTTGVKKIKLIDNLSISSSYNLLADSLNLAPFSVSLRTTFYKNVGLNLNATFDPYQVNANGQRINKFMLQKGKLARLTSLSFAFGYSFNSQSSNQPAVNDINSGYNTVPPEYSDFFDPNNEMDPNTRRQLMTATYYNFDIPWNFGFNYSFNYTNNGVRKNVIQTLGFNASVTLTSKWGITFNGGYDFEARKLTPGTFTLSRDLHCWQMSFNWVPVGFRKSWSFTIGVKSSSLSDLKIDKRNSYYDNLYDN